jgi:hypothetical protein
MKKNFNINPPLEMSEVMSKMCKAMKKTLAASEKLSKPYVSDAQRKWAHTEAGTKALGGKSHVHEWDEATKGKKLPEHISKSELEKFDSEVGSYMAKAKVDEGKTPREKMHIRENRAKNVPMPKPELAPHVKSAHAINQVESAVAHTSDARRRLNEAASDAEFHARQTQRNRIKHEQGIKKPKLTRSELEKFDKEIEGHMAKAAGAPGQMPKPTLAKLPQPNLKQPATKMPSIKSPAMKTPTMKQPQMVKADIVRPDAGYGTVTVKAPPPPPVGKVIMKDDMPHPPGSPEERSHAVAEHMTSLPNALKDVHGHAAKKKFFDHLRSLKSAKDMRSPENVLTPQKKK